MLIIKWLVMALAIAVSAYFTPGVTLAGAYSALLVALLFAVINVSLKPVLVVLTLPINILTLGLFTFVINALMVLLASSIIKGFTVDGFLSAMLFSIILSFVSYILNTIFITK